MYARPQDQNPVAVRASESVFVSIFGINFQILRPPRTPLPPPRRHCCTRPVRIRKKKIGLHNDVESNFFFSVSRASSFPPEDPQKAARPPYMQGIHCFQGSHFPVLVKAVAKEFFPIRSGRQSIGFTKDLGEVALRIEGQGRGNICIAGI